MLEVVNAVALVGGSAKDALRAVARMNALRRCEKISSADLNALREDLPMLTKCIVSAGYASMATVEMASPKELVTAIIGQFRMLPRANS